MIKFFRKIRQNLVNERKTSKYLKYAIGEVALVVIGILIVLSINNWNEDNKELKAEQKILRTIQPNFSFNLKEIKEDIVV